MIYDAQQLIFRLAHFLPKEIKTMAAFCERAIL